jgi:hypothetical protein
MSVTDELALANSSGSSSTSAGADDDKPTVTLETSPKQHEPEIRLPRRDGREPRASRGDGDSLDLDWPGNRVAVRDQRFDVDLDRLADHRQRLLAGFALARTPGRAGTATLNPPSASGVSTISYSREVDIGSASPPEAGLMAILRVVVAGATRESNRRLEFHAYRGRGHLIGPLRNPRK